MIRKELASDLGEVHTGFLGKWRNRMSKSFGIMVGGEEALNILDRIFPMIVFENKKEEIEITELFARMRNRFAYHIDQDAPVGLKYHKGKYGSKYDSWTCSNCGCGITHSVIQNFCWNCGHRLDWDTPRCLTGVKKFGKDDDTDQIQEEVEDVPCVQMSFEDFPEVMQ